MRIAYIILCHTDPEHIRRLTKKITGGTDDEAFIHVDGKCDAAPFEQTLKDIFCARGSRSIGEDIPPSKRPFSCSEPPFYGKDSRLTVSCFCRGWITRSERIGKSTPFWRKKPKRNFSSRRTFPNVPIPMRPISIRCTGFWIRKQSCGPKSGTRPIPFFF